MEYSLTEGALTKYSWNDYHHLLLLMQEGGVVTIMKGVHKGENMVTYLPHMRF